MVLDRTDRRWRPGLPAPMARLLLVVLALHAAVRGTAWLLPEPAGGPIGTALGRASLPEWTWGLLWVAAALVVIAGTMCRRYLMVLLGSLTCSAVALATAWGVMWLGLTGGVTGWRAPVGMLLTAAVWALIAAGTWWRRQLDDERSAYGPDVD